ncbi:tRNA pseudouridine(38-40) synthase TruA [Aphanothece hegewaldii CCALA 016]|uniref:tRNA pseudouridine synthase A n=1 Tax=Aphanothece hegewaldii CCALA 016 TaxID=2107694 RepID=A0A2T1M3I8_9CHRO|nr:tRNA pseudouridine(38-40) synthase TruA [Aphanothece hegewaldii]PSF39407.1 tRNA pseudouridine(38-40) synthase TruA [Aphanothece hegewaldii CCALA 016]
MLTATIKPSERVALVIQYLGTHFYGWQRQPNRRSVQEEIETAIANVLNHPVTLHGAGRTDTGVHAAAQVAHFDHNSPIPAFSWANVLNAKVSDDIVIRASERVSPSWHARFDALWRRYRYTIYTGKRPNLFIKPYSWHYYREPIESELMKAALFPLLGKHDLAAFQKAGSHRQHSWVEIQDVECQRNGSLIRLEIQANGFLYGMVRLLVGMLVEVGSGKRSLDNFTQIWLNGRREEVKYSAPAKGLCLLRVGYPEFPFPDHLWYDTQPLFSLHESNSQ